MLNAGGTQKNYWRLFFLSLVDLVSGSPESFIVPYVFIMSQHLCSSGSSMP